MTAAALKVTLKELIKQLQALQILL